MATYEQLVGAARQAHEKGDRNAAKRFLELAQEAKPQKKQSILEKAVATSKKAREAMTFGLLGDEFNAGVAGIMPGGRSYDEQLERDRSQEAILERDNPGLALGAEIGGGILSLALPGSQIGTLGRGAGLMAKAGASSATGAGMGGLYGFMEGEGDGRSDSAIDGALFGGTVGMAAPVAGATIKGGVDKLMQRGPMREARKAAQTAAQQRAAAGADYSVFENSGAEVSGDAMRRLTSSVRGRLQGDMVNIPGPVGKLEGNAQKIVGTMDAIDADLGKMASQNPNVPLKNVEGIRKELGRYAQERGPDFRPTNDARWATMAIDEIDGFVDGLRAADVPVGDPTAAKSALKKAREMWRRSIKTQKVENAIEGSERYLSGPASGLRFQIKSLLRKNQKEKLFTPKEEEALKKIIGNNMASRAIRTLGDGLGRKMATFGGGMAGGPMGAAVGAGAGELATQLGDATTMRRALQARDMISTGALNNIPEMPDHIRRLIEASANRTAVGQSQ